MIQQQVLTDKKCIFFVLIVLFMTFAISSFARAENNQPDDVKVSMKNGEIVFEVTTKAASSENSIRYRTTGFTLSLSPQTKTVTAKGLRGPDVPPLPGIPLTFDKKTEIERTDELLEQSSEFHSKKSRQQ